ncbi:MAG: hypothetical protein JWN63_2847 [Candidatus Acidoferrum typicum]|nr:hypothetical protein [Candidatus Acidoferrum typicum]
MSRECILSPKEIGFTETFPTGETNATADFRDSPRQRPSHPDPPAGPMRSKLDRIRDRRASYNGSIEASQASDVGSIPIARSMNPNESDVLERTRLGPARRRSTIRRSHLTSKGQSDRSASMTLMRAARAAGSADATTAAASRTSAEATTGAALGICISRK